MPTLTNITEGDLTALLPGQPPLVVEAGGTVDVPDESYDPAAWSEGWDAPGRAPEPSPDPTPEVEPPVEAEPPKSRKK